MAVSWSSFNPLLRSKTRLSLALIIPLIALLTYIIDARRSREAKREFRMHHRRNSGILQTDGSKVLLVGNGDEVEKIRIYPTRPITFEAHRRLFLDKRGEAAAPLEGKVGLNRRFARQFDGIFAIIVPRFQSRETALILAHLSLLMVRTYMSLLVARLDGAIVRDLVSANGKEFLKGLGLWFTLAIPASYCNNMIKFIQRKLSLSFRTRLTRYVHDLYLNDKLPYYRVLTEGEIGGIDQFIAVDIAKFSDSCASILSNVGKPMVDLFVFNYQLKQNLGPGALALLLSTYAATAYIIRTVSPSFGRLAAAESRLESEFRNGHARLITNSEEVAFYNGAEKEHEILNRSFDKLMRHINSSLRVRLLFDWMEDYVIKYSWSSLGLLSMAIPIFFPRLGGSESILDMVTLTKEGPEQQQRARTRAFITNKRLMLSLAEAGGRMMYSYKDLAELAGYTARVYTLLSTLHRVHANAYDPRHVERFSLADAHGTIQGDYDGVRLEDVPIVAPAKRGLSGEELVEDLTLKVVAGEHLLITGGNGTGKSAIVRVMAGLWPLYAGLLSRPASGEIVYIAQKPYLSRGTLRDQLIYPDSHADMVDSGRRDRELLQILEIFRLEFIVHREGGWETKKDWTNCLSGGEKQRINLARLFYHNPRFAVLDEATSAVSTDVEGIIYQEAKKRGITLITISTRPTLLKFHTHQLRIGLGPDGHSWDFAPIGVEKERMTVEAEIAAIKRQLAEVDGLQRRRTELEEQLSMRAPIIVNA